MFHKLKLNHNMEEIEYKGELINKFGENDFVVYLMNPDGDIDDEHRTSLEAAKKLIDEHIEYLAECGIVYDCNE